MLSIDATPALDIAALRALHTFAGIAPMQKMIRDILLCSPPGASSIQVLSLRVEAILRSGSYSFGSKDVQSSRARLQEMLLGK